MKAQVRNIRVGERVTEDGITDTFVMSNMIGQDINVRQVSEHWFTYMDGNPYRFHESWLDFSSDDANKGEYLCEVCGAPMSRIESDEFLTVWNKLDDLRTTYPRSFVQDTYGARPRIIAKSHLHCIDEMDKYYQVIWATDNLVIAIRK